QDRSLARTRHGGPVPDRPRRRLVPRLARDDVERAHPLSTRRHPDPAKHPPAGLAARAGARRRPLATRSGRGRPADRSLDVARRSRRGDPRLVARRPRPRRMAHNHAGRLNETERTGVVLSTNENRADRGPTGRSWPAVRARWTRRLRPLVVDLAP